MLDVQALDSSVAAQLKAHSIPGLALAVVHKGAVLYARGYGVTSVEGHGHPVTPDTLFRIGSVTKPLTGTMIMRLVEQELLNLDRPVSHYLDWVRFSEPGREHEITLRMLLNRTSGLSSVANAYGDRNPIGLESTLREIIPTLAAHIATVAAGKPFATLMQEMVFGPLQMHCTTFDPLVAMTYPLALPHHKAADGTMQQKHTFVEHTGRA